jgi:cytochrome c553
MATLYDRDILNLSLKKCQEGGIMSQITTTLSQQEADELNRHIAEARKNPPPMPKRKMKTKDASFLY